MEHHVNGSAEGTRWERPDAPLGTLIYRAGLLSKDKLESALEEGRRSGRRLGEILLQKGWLEEKDLARLLAGQKGLAFVSLRGRGFDEETARSLPERVCRFHNAMAVGYEAGELLVAIADPGNDDAVADIRREVGQPFRLVVATPTEIRTALDDTFGGGRVATPAPAVAVPLTPPVLTNGSGEFGAGLRIAAPAEPTPEPAPVAEAAPTPEPKPLREPNFVEAAPAPATVHEADRAPAPEPEPEPEPDAARELVPAFAVSEPDAAVEADAPHVGPVPPAFGVAERESDSMPGSPLVDEAPPSEPELAREPEAPAVPEIRIEQLEPPEPRREDPTGAPPDGWGPRIERNEEAHVSVAFHAPPVPEPAPVAAPIAAAPEAPEVRPEPAAPVEPAAQTPPRVGVEGPASDEEHRFRIVLELDGDEELDVATFADTTAAEEAARDFIARLARRDEWPLIGNRFVRPERIRSIEIRERQRFAGSSRRALWGGDEDDR